MAARAKKRTVSRNPRKKSAGKAKEKSSAAKKKGAWGGARRGAGRPKGSGSGPSPDSRRNRIAIMLSDVELRSLLAIARAKDLPPSTAAYSLLKHKLR